MLNLLRGDFYKLKYSKSFYFAMAFIALFVTYLIVDFSSSAHIKEQLYPSTFHWIYLPFSDDAFMPIFLPFVQGIFITMFITSEYSYGTVKDSIALGYSRVTIYLSKLITISFATIMILLVAILVTAVMSILVFGFYGSFTMQDFLELVRMAMIQGYLFVAFASLFLMIATVIKNMGGVMAVSIFLVLLLNSFGSMMVNVSWGKLLLIMNFVPTAVPEPSPASFQAALWMGLAYLLVCSLISLIFFRRQDIK